MQKEGKEEEGSKMSGLVKLQLTMTEQMRAGTRRSMPTNPPKQKQRKNPTRVKVR